MLYRVSTRLLVAKTGLETGLQTLVSAQGTKEDGILSDLHLLGQ